MTTLIKQYKTKQSHKKFFYINLQQRLTANRILHVSWSLFTTLTDKLLLAFQLCQPIKKANKRTFSALQTNLTFDWLCNEKTLHY